MRENFHSNNTKYSHETRRFFFLLQLTERNSISRREKTDRSRWQADSIFKRLAIYSPITGVNEGERGAISTGNYSDTCSPTRSIDLKNGKSRGERISALKTGVVITLYSRIVSLNTPRAVISIVFFRGKTRGWENSKVEATQIPSRDASFRA